MIIREEDLSALECWFMKSKRCLLLTWIISDIVHVLLIINDEDLLIWMYDKCLLRGSKLVDVGI